MAHLLARGTPGQLRAARNKEQGALAGNNDLERAILTDAGEMQTLPAAFFQTFAG